jgi:hypothetical protein
MKVAFRLMIIVCFYVTLNSAMLIVVQKGLEGQALELYTLLSSIFVFIFVLSFSNWSNFKPKSGNRLRYIFWVGWLIFANPIAICFYVKLFF